MEKFHNAVKKIIEEEPIKGQNLKLLGFGAEKMVFEIPGSKEKKSPSTSATTIIVSIGFGR